MNEGGWNLVDHSSSHASDSSGDGSPDKDAASGTAKQASFAWRGGQERQTTGQSVS